MRRHLAPALAALAAACAAERPAPAARFDPGPVPAELAAGHEVYRAACIACHGEHAAGTTSGPPLVHIYYEPNHHADEAFRRAIRFGVQPHHWDFGPMPPVRGLGLAEEAAVIAYVRWLQRQGGIY